MSDALADTRFTGAIVAEFLNSIKTAQNSGLGADCIAFAYGDNGTRKMRLFVVDLFMTNVCPADFAENVIAYPAEFKEDLCIAALGLLRDRPTHKDLLARYTDGEYELQDDEDENTITGWDLEV